MDRGGAIQEAWNVAGCCNASQDAQDTWDAENMSLASGRNARGSDAGSVFADRARTEMDLSGLPTPVSAATAVDLANRMDGKPGCHN